jgi:sulfur carrier protein
MRVWVNDEEHQTEAETTVARLVDTLGAGTRGIAVAVNAEVVPRSAWATSALCDGDRVEVLRAVQGGC